MYHFNKGRVDARAIDEMIGVCKGIISDSKVNHLEAMFLQDWMEANLSCCEDVMINRIYRRIHEMLIDKVFDDNEKQELFELLRMFTGNNCILDVSEGLTSTLPVDDPQPSVEFQNRIFCLTGQFVYGSRKVCEAAVEDLGGMIDKTVTRKTDYLVTGLFVTKSWSHSSYGGKIQRAVSYRERNGYPSIITEDHWAKYAFTH